MTLSVEVLDLAGTDLWAMGTDVHLLVLDGCDDDLHWASAEIDRLEALWSRFRDDSDVARINQGAGRAVRVSRETLELVEVAEAARRTTVGFDPLLGLDLADLGYDRTFEAIHPEGAHRDPVGRPRAAVGAGIQVDREAVTVRIPDGTALDLGGIAKGWTADRLVERLLGRGAAGACANLGGDLAVGGRPPHPSGWVIDVEHSAAGRRRVLARRSGGVATSTVLRRRWQGPSGESRHHLLDPTTGAPCATSIVEVTVVAGSAAQAEVLTKAAFVAPDRFSGALADAGAAAIVTQAAGVTEDVGDPALLGDGSREEWSSAGC